MSDTEPTTGARTEGEVELVYDDTPAPPGRPVRLEPTPPGLWRVLGGGIVAVLAPFFGILIGSTMGRTPEPPADLDPIYWGFFAGSVIGALGLVSVGFGIRQLRRNPRRPRQEQEDDW